VERENIEHEPSTQSIPVELPKRYHQTPQDCRSSWIHRPTAALLGSGAAAVSLVIIWAARAAVGRPVYVSELGAASEPTAGWFRLALLLIAASCFLIGWSIHGRSTVRPLLNWPHYWSISLSVGAAGSLFFIASQVPCTTGCPLPAGSNAIQDFSHTLSAALAFSFGIVAMLQTAASNYGAPLRVLSMCCGLAVLFVASSGGILSLLQIRTDTGGLLEFIATTIGLVWFVIFGLFAAIERPPLPHVKKHAG